MCYTTRIVVFQKKSDIFRSGTDPESVRRLPEWLLLQEDLCSGALPSTWWVDDLSEKKEIKLRYRQGLMNVNLSVMLDTWWEPAEFYASTCVNLEYDFAHCAFCIFSYSSNFKEYIWVQRAEYAGIRARLSDFVEHLWEPRSVVAQKKEKNGSCLICH